VSGGPVWIFEPTVIYILCVMAFTFVSVFSLGVLHALQLVMYAVGLLSLDWD
jgi:hypothetical protein